MDLLTLEICVVSAEDLNKLDLASKMKTYVVATLTSGVFCEQKAQTNVDMEGGENPKWNFAMKFLVDRNASKAQGFNNSHLTFTLKSENPLGDKCIGEIKVPIAELMQSTGDGNSMQYVSCPVMGTSGQTTNAKFNFIFKFGALQAQAQAQASALAEKSIAAGAATGAATSVATGAATGVATGVAQAVASFGTRKFVEGLLNSDQATAVPSNTETAVESADASSSMTDVLENMCSFM